MRKHTKWSGGNIVVYSAVLMIIIAIACACNMAKAAEVAVTPQGITVVAGPSVVQTTPVVRYRTWGYSASVVRTPVVTQRTVVVQRPAPVVPVVTLDAAQPWVNRGVFRDRVVIPRRPIVSVTVQ